MSAININKEKVTKILKTAGSISVIVIALITGAALMELSYRISVKNAKKGVVYQRPKTTSEVSVAVNDRSELMIIDRSNGSYTLYQDSVGRRIFNMYAAQIYIDNKNE